MLFLSCVNFFSSRVFYLELESKFRHKTGLKQQQDLIFFKSQSCLRTASCKSAEFEIRGQESYKMW